MSDEERLLAEALLAIQIIRELRELIKEAKKVIPPAQRKRVQRRTRKTKR